MPLLILRPLHALQLPLLTCQQSLICRSGRAALIPPLPLFGLQDLRRLGRKQRPALDPQLLDQRCPRAGEQRLGAHWC
jgi:hypothetical protein